MPAPSQLAKPSTGGRLPREPDFWLLWSVGFMLFVVRWTEMVAFGVYAYQETGSAFLVAMMSLLRIMPMGLLGVFLGDLADRLERRTGLVLMTGICLLTAVTLLTLGWFGQLQVWHLGAASFVNGVAWAADTSFRRVMVGDVVGIDRMGHAMSIDVGSTNTTRMAGPIIGGLLLGTAGIFAVFVFAVICSLVATVAALCIRHRSVVTGHSPGLFFARMIESVKAASRNPGVAGPLMTCIIYNLFAWPISSMIPVIGQDELNLGAKGIGILASLEGVGALIGAVIIAAFVTQSSYRLLHTGGVTVYTIMIVLFAFAPSPSIAAVALLLAGFGGIGFSITLTTLTYQAVGPELRGRMLGLQTTCVGTAPLGLLHIGWLVEAIGTRPAILLSGFECLAALYLARRLWRERAAPRAS